MELCGVASDRAPSDAAVDKSGARHPLFSKMEP